MKNEGGMGKDALRAGVRERVKQQWLQRLHEVKVDRIKSKNLKILRLAPLLRSCYALLGILTG